MRPWGIAALALGLSASLVAGAAPSFSYVRPIVPGGAGPNRLTVDVSLMTGARPLRLAGSSAAGLEDLRLFAADGTEVAYLLVTPPSPERHWQGGRLQPIVPTDETSGFEVDLGAVVSIDRVRVSGLPPPLLKRVRVEGSGDRLRWVLLAEDATIFDLPEEGLRRTEIAFDPTTARHLRFTWDDRASGRVALPATVAVELATTPVASPPAVVPLGFERRPSEPGTSRFRIRLPGPGLPIRALELDCGNDRLLRRVRVTEAALVGDAMTPRELGSGVLRRVARDALVASDLRVAVRSPSELELEVEVDDADNPPLDLRGVRAELPALPWIYFESPTGAALTAKFGARELAAPRYDLEAARGTLDVNGLHDATWGDRAGLPEPPEGEPDAGIVTFGAPIDRAAFRHVRRLPPGPAGLTALRLDAAVLAHSSALADVRLIDAAGRQIPYVVEHVAEPLTVELPAPAVEPAGDGADRVRRTSYRIELPYRRLPISRLVLTTEGRLFERGVTVRVERDSPDRRSGLRFETITTATWRHADPERPAPSLTLALPSLDRTTVLVVVDDGDNSRLAPASARLLLPTHRLRFVRPGDAEVVLAYGAAGMVAPRYDLALLAPRILGASAHELDASPEEGIAGDEPAEPGEVVGRRVFWAVLLVAALVLVVVLVRLVRVEERPDAA